MLSIETANQGSNGYETEAEPAERLLGIECRGRSSRPSRESSSSRSSASEISSPSAAPPQVFSPTRCRSSRRLPDHSCYPQKWRSRKNRSWDNFDKNPWLGRNQLQKLIAKFIRMINKKTPCWSYTPAAPRIRWSILEPLGPALTWPLSQLLNSTWPKNSLWSSRAWLENPTTLDRWMNISKSAILLECSLSAFLAWTIHHLWNHN